MRQIRLDLRLEKPRVKKKLPYKVTRFRHLINTPQFLSHIIKFLTIYPFSASIIGQIFNIKLKPSYFQAKKIKTLLDHLDWIKKINMEEKQRKNNIFVKKKMVKRLLSTIIKKNIINYKKRYNLSKYKYNKLIGINYKNKYLRIKNDINYKILKSETINDIVKELNKKKIKKNKKSTKTHKSFIKTGFILNNLNKKKTLKSNAKKSLIYNNNVESSCNKLDFFYHKHIKDLETYLFK